MMLAPSLDHLGGLKAAAEVPCCFFLRCSSLAMLAERPSLRVLIPTLSQVFEMLTPTICGFSSDIVSLHLGTTLLAEGWVHGGQCFLDDA